MSAPLVNRSLTTIRTELEFLYDSEVITEDLFKKLNEALPPKYQKDMKAWGVDHIEAKSEPAPEKSSTDKLAQDFQSTSISTPSSEHLRPAPPPHTASGPKTLSYCEVIYDFQAQESDDLNVLKGDKIGVVEHLSEDWWKGFKKGEPSKVGVFPSNYIKPISEKEFEEYGSGSRSEKAEYNSGTQYNSYNSQQGYQPSPQQGYAQPGYGQYQSPPSYNQPLQQNPSGGDYSQFPPPSTNYYNNQQQAPPQEQQQAEGQHQVHPHLRKFGGKLGNAAIFGAGATIGSDIVNSIF